MSISEQARDDTITAQAVGLAFPDVPGFKGQGWSTQETVMVVRWLFANPAAWDQAMDVARKYPENPHTVADTLHETIVPRSELDAIATAGGDPARVNWLEIGHELIERRDDPRPAEAPATIATQAVGLASGYELNPRSGMISLDLPPGIITPVPGGVSDHHVTICYLGEDVDDEAFAQACDRARQAATAMPGPLAGMVGGIGTFPASDGSDGKVPAWAGVVLPGAEQIRASLEDLSASEHKDWKPHVTVAYTEPGEPLPAPVPQMQVVFTHLSVHRGEDEVARFPLGGDPAGSAQAEPVSVSEQAGRPAGSPALPQT